MEKNTPDKQNVKVQINCARFLIQATNKGLLLLGSRLKTYPFYICIVLDNNRLHPKPNQMCDKTSTPTKPKITLMITGIIVLATLALIISMSNLFIHRLTGRFRMTNHLRNLPDIIHV